ncbi:hypothetical protein L5L55_17425 [Shewanella glacialipiscicola]|uniref:hypothetical protein n=1 Tax=Shewanella glacialipiscicola TaxID=614069 RepID=UPI0021D807F1|nr:hypothetical protein [Shewanella glacialipiscicola]MCU7996650.1 hypothetical protein [Shewanella glacialipiscicola]MCU8027963.1 hypothetical protein [Shewanella glacialipiscicola]
MKKIMIQFHATLEELVEYINSTSSDLGLVVTVMVLRPFGLRETDGELSVEALNIDGDVRIIFTVQKPSMDASSPNNFYDLNPGTIGLHIGLLTEQGLKESALVFMSDDKEKAVIANKVASRLKKLTKAGATAVNPVNGAEANARTHRYTSGAEALYNEGIKILPVAGSSFFKLTG